MYEKEWHNYFSKYPHTGEWYNIPEDILLENLKYYNDEEYYFTYKDIAVQKTELFYLDKNGELVDVLDIYYNRLFESVEYVLKYIQSNCRTNLPITTQVNFKELILFMQTLNEDYNSNTLYALYQNKAKQLVDYFNDNCIV